MSVALLSYLCSLFGREERSDCTITFYRSRDAKQSQAGIGANTKWDVTATAVGLAAATITSTTSNSPGRAEVIGEPLPAHLLVICPGAAYFDAQASRWMHGEASGSIRPELRVPLNSPDELPHVRAAIRFIYTGQLGDTRDAADLLRVRRLAAYLQVEGCVGACDSALLALVTASVQPPQGIAPAAAGSASLPGSRGPTPGGLLAGVSELYACRQLLPAPDDDPGAAGLLERLYSLCRAQLVAHSGISGGSASGSAGVVAGQGTGSPEPGPSLGELLAWAFRDAPSALSDREAKRQVRALFAEALEALLGCDSFATDGEETVLVLLAEWLDAHRDVTPAVRERLCRLVRLCQMDDAYLLQVLPLLTWFPISRAEHAFLCHFVRMDAGRRARLASEADPRYNCRSPWYAAPARPQSRSDRGRVYKWNIRQAELASPLVKPGGRICLWGNFSGGIQAVVGHGAEWRPYIMHRMGEGTAGIYLSCSLPAALGAGAVSEDLVMLSTPGAACLTVYRWGPDGAREAACQIEYGELLVAVGGGSGAGDGLTLKEAPPPSEGPADPLAPWAPYLKDGKLTGKLVWG